MTLLKLRNNVPVLFLPPMQTFLGVSHAFLSHELRDPRFANLSTWSFIRFTSGETTATISDQQLQELNCKQTIELDK